MTSWDNLRGMFSYMPCVRCLPPVLAVLGLPEIWCLLHRFDALGGSVRHVRARLALAKGPARVRELPFAHPQWR